MSWTGRAGAVSSRAPMSRSLAIFLLIGCGGPPQRAATAAEAVSETAAVEPTGERQSLLGGRLTVTAGGFTRRGRPHSVMSGPDPDDLETFLFREHRTERFGFVARELFTRCDDDFAADAEHLARVMDDPLSEPFRTERIDATEDLHVVAFVPDEPVRHEDVAAIVESAVCHPDGTMQWVRAMIAGPDLDGRRADAVGEALAMLRSLREGPTRRASEARTVELATYADGAPIRARVPDGWVTYAMEGPDFRVHYLQRLSEPESEANATIGLYLGDHPSPHEGESREGTLFGETVRWLRSQSEGSIREEAMCEPPIATGTAFAHVFLGASDETLLAEARAIVASFEGSPR
jgi:hypothetical protein